MSRGRIGAWAWVTALQFYVVEWLVARSRPSYSYRTDVISDLGTLASPHHLAMNVSFVALGLAIAAGGLLTSGWLPSLAGAGAVLVGLFPSDTVGALHTVGAAAFFLAGNAGLVLIGRREASILVVAGVLGLIATVLFVAGVPEPGIVERLAAYPVSAGYAYAGLTRLVAGGPATSRT